MSVYSIEELCYYFYDKTHLIDDSFVTSELVEWIRVECGLEELADELDIYARKHMSVASFVSTIFDYTGMYDENTVKRIERTLKEQANLPPVERNKKRADYLFNQGRFREALDIYREMLDCVPTRDTVTMASVYYNMATVYAMDFAYSLAAELYYEAYLLKPDRETRLAYILANKFALTDYAYGAFKRENPEWVADFDEAERRYNETLEKWENVKDRQVADIDRLRRDYKRQTQN
jgi:pentatricopeptide repeat protein